jgi:hypothetical protein
MNNGTKATPCKLCGERHEGEEGHHCPEWDFMFVKPTDEEMEVCLCQTKP